VPARLGALLAVIFWGASFVATKAAVAEVSPIALIFVRTGIGAFVLLALLGGRPDRAIPWREEGRALALMGFVGIAFHQLLQAFALTMTSATHTGWLVGLTPLWSALLAAIHLREGLGARKALGLATGFFGAILVVTRGRLDAGQLALPATRGDLLILAGTVNWAVYTVIGHPTLRRLGSLRATAGAMLLGWLMLAPPFVFAAGWRHLGQVSLQGWAAIVFLGTACSALGYLFWYGALEKIQASRVSALLYLEPLVTAGTAALLLGESLGVSTLLGGLLLLAGVALVQTAPGAGD
jgi:drug/metabolite transporter (DMT)-like permease